MKTLFNLKIYRKYKQSAILKVIKCNRLPWHGHLHRSIRINPVKNLTSPMGKKGDKKDHELSGLASWRRTLTLYRREAGEV